MKGRSRKGRGLFPRQPPRHRDLARIVTFESVGKAEKARTTLWKKFKAALKRHDLKRALAIKRAAQLAANRAKAGTKNPKFTPKTRHRWRRIASIYNGVEERMKKAYPRRRG